MLIPTTLVLSCTVVLVMSDELINKASWPNQTRHHQIIYVCLMSSKCTKEKNILYSLFPVFLLEQLPIQSSLLHASTFLQYLIFIDYSYSGYISQIVSSTISFCLLFEKRYLESILHFGNYLNDNVQLSRKNIHGYLLQCVQMNCASNIHSLALSVHRNVHPLEINRDRLLVQYVQPLHLSPRTS